LESNEMTDDQAAALVLGGGCCCLLGLVGIVVLIIVLTRKKPAAQAQAAPPAGYSSYQPPPPPQGPAPMPPYSPYTPSQPQPPPYAPPGSTPSPYAPPQPGATGAQEYRGATHLAVLAVGLDLTVRDALAHELNLPIGATNALDMRVALVQRVSAVLLRTEHAWRYFGYGEKALPDLGSAEQSYRANVEDFRLRSNVLGEALGTVAVVTVVLATRAPLAGVTRLDDPSQLRASLQSWQALQAHQLLGAEYLWAPTSGGLTDESMARRFPEMQRLLR
jgi:hypothetical protein